MQPNINGSFFYNQPIIVVIVVYEPVCFKVCVLHNLENLAATIIISSSFDILSALML